MNGFVQTLSDVKLIVSTDKRLWAMGAFLFSTAFVFFVTQTWREPPPPPPEEYVRVRIDEDVNYRSIVTSVTKDFKTSQIERKQLRDEVVRAANDINSQTQEMDWHVDSLVDRMNSVTEKLDNLAQKVGDSTIRKSQIDQKIKGQKSGVKRKIPVQGSDL